MGTVHRLPLNIVCEAIRTRSVLEFEYHHLHRVVAPYCHGLSGKGVQMLRAVQLSGASGSGAVGFGKLWFLDEIVAPRITGEHFAPHDPDYNAEDPAMAVIHCRVSLPLDR